MLQKWWIWILVVMAAASCNHKVGKVPAPANGAYYWRTTSHLDSTERAFLAQHQVKKLFLRFFDLVPDGKGSVKPNATLRFADSLPSGVEVIPTVFITEPCMKARLDSIPRLLVARILTMCEVNGVAPIQEVQLDCDWTASSEAAYFRFLEQVRALLKEKSIRLSATIRLHQLRTAPPPVDYGALMLYNTGDATNRQCPNPILDMAAVEPYLKHLATYELPLCAAYPVFAWKLLFAGSTFKGIAYEANLADTTLFRAKPVDTYLAVSCRELLSSTGAADAVRINPGNEILYRQVPFSLIEAVRSRVEEFSPHINEQVIIFDLNAENIRRYKPSEYEKIYRH
ncbi:MAG: hypothetical protein ACI30R_02345 [Sodaliphilus sp.]